MEKREQGFEGEIRRKLAQAPADFDESAWERMERKLSEGDARKKRRLPVWWWRGAAALVLLFVGIWAYTGLWQKYDPAEQQPGANIARNESGDAGKPDREEGESAGKQSPGSSGGSNDDGRTARNGADGNEGTDPVPGESFAEGGTPDPRRTPGRAAGTQPGETVALNPGGGRTAPPIGQVWGEAEGIHLESIPAGAVPVQGPDRVPEAGLPASRLKTVSVVPERGRSAPVFSLGLAAAPDLNAVGTFEGGQLGFNGGFTVGVHFNDRLSLHSGIIYSKKPYDARPSDYRLSAPVPYLENIAASCDVIDIPLDLQYTFYRKGATGIAVSAGLSSYLMLKEEYSYEYNSGYSKAYEYRNENRHFMGVANAGVLLEHKLSDRTAIGLQPFVKVPLTGIGHGNVKLISAGAAIRLNLQLNKK